MAKPDAIFIGGGVVGLSAAWRAASLGLSVTVVDPSPGRGASWVAAGMLAPVTEAHFGEEPLLELLVAAAEGWASFAEALEAASGAGIGFRRCGTVMVAADASDRAVVDRLLHFQHAHGLTANRLTATACRALVPALAPGVSGGAEVPGDHQVDNRRLLAALRRVCDAAGVVQVGASVCDVVADGTGRAAGVRLADGSTLGAGAVVVTAGAGSGRLGGLADGALPPVRPVKGHILRLRGPAGHPLLERTVRGIVRGRPCYLVPRADGSVVVGATAEERGFDRSVQAGAVRELLGDACALVPGVDELTLEECAAGLRPGSPDNAPFVGWTAVGGLAAAVGHYRNGILLAPITADAVAALLTGAAPPVALAPFDVHRLTAVSGR